MQGQGSTMSFQISLSLVAKRNQILIKRRVRPCGTLAGTNFITLAHASRMALSFVIFENNYN